MIKHISLAVTLLLFQFANASPQQFSFTPEKGQVLFHAIGRPSAIKINGTGEGARGTLTIGADGKMNGHLTFNLNSLTSGIDLRDHHMKEKYLEVGKYSQAELLITSLPLTEPVLAETTGKSPATEESLPFNGQLKLKDVTKNVSGTAKIKKAASALEIEAQFSLKLDDYGIDIPKYLGVTVASEVQIEVKAQPALISADKNASP